MEKFCTLPSSRQTEKCIADRPGNPGHLGQWCLGKDYDSGQHSPVRLEILIETEFLILRYMKVSIILRQIALTVQEREERELRVPTLSLIVSAEMLGLRLAALFCLLSLIAR